MGSVFAGVDPQLGEACPVEELASVVGGLGGEPLWVFQEV